MIFMSKAVVSGKITHNVQPGHRGGAPLIPASTSLKYQEYNNVRTCFSSPSLRSRYRQNRYLRLHLAAFRTLPTAYMTNDLLHR